MEPFLFVMQQTLEQRRNDIIQRAPAFDSYKPGSFDEMSKAPKRTYQQLIALALYVEFA